MKLVEVVVVAKGGKTVATALEQGAQVAAAVSWRGPRQRARRLAHAAVFAKRAERRPAAGLTSKTSTRPRPRS